MLIHVRVRKPHAMCEKAIWPYPNFNLFYLFWIKCEPCPSKINRWQLVRNIPPGTKISKKDNNSLIRKHFIQTFFFCIVIHVLCLQNMMRSYPIVFHIQKCKILVDNPPISFITQFIINHNWNLGMVCDLIWTSYGQNFVHD
jgi:hypothetical protein